MNTPTRATYYRRRAVVLVGLLALSACGVQAGQKVASGTTPKRQDSNILGSDVTPPTSAPATTTAAAVPPADVQINGSDGSEVDNVIGNAVSDLQDWWKTQFPKAYGGDYQPISGGLYAIDSSTDASTVPCATSSDISALLNNAFYCPNGDAVVWDQESFMPQLAKQYGDFTVAMVIAHEWGHAIQNRAQFSAPSVITELQADCFAGAWTKHVSDGESKRFSITTSDLDTAITGILALRDAPGGAADDQMAHGSGFDRVGAFQDGFEDGVTRCAEFRDGDPAPYEFPYSDPGDANANGNLQLTGTTDEPGITDLVFPSLKAYWTDTFPKLSTDGKAWDPLGDPVAFSPDDPPTCGGKSTSGSSVFVCIPDRFVGYDAQDTIPQIYQQGGDFAVATLFATRYGLDAVHQLGTAKDDASAALQGDCLAGSWAAALLPPNPPESYQLVLSPGDLDEGVAVLMQTSSSGGSGSANGGGDAFQRVKAYRTGVIKGADACLSLEAG
ncbi:neutral zinc metallopeptidase [Aquihabitans sp. McL0605]|uniref:neutral zinc metallopeptidase n=1 Tax=Aquihabitans sp. McL0605 TaxID=3415671 RepID=UPI003CECEFDF